MVNLDEIELGPQISELEKSLDKKDIAIIGLSQQAFGYSPRAYNYIDKLANAIKFRPRDLKVFNAYLPPRMTESHIEDMLAANISLEDIKLINQYENKEKIKKFIHDVGLPETKSIISLIYILLGIKERYIFEDDKKTYLRDIIKQKNEVHIFYAPDILDMPVKSINEELEKRRRNFHTLHALNPNVNIYTIGLTTPNHSSKEIELVDKINVEYQKIASEFGSIYVNTNGLENYFKKLGRTHYLSDDGISFLSLRCIEAMYQAKIEETEKPEIAKILFIDEKNDQIHHLLRKSVDYAWEIQKMISSTDNEDKDYLTRRLDEEQERQKIYHKVMKEHNKKDIDN